MNNEYEASKAQKASVARYVGLTIVLINAVLEMIGMPIIPLENSEIISAAILVGMGLYAGFKNNYLTRFGKTQATILANHKQLKNK